MNRVHEGEPSGVIRVAVQGCLHGELDKVYKTIASINEAAQDGKKVDLLICCGDFQAVRNQSDLECMACPPKYRSMQTFWKYYSGQEVAPVPTIFIGGNHEASNYLQELPYGGWVAENIFYMGSSGVVNFGGLRIAGVSGIFKRYDFKKGYFEAAPYNPDTIRSVCHQREFDFWRLSHLTPQLNNPNAVDIFISHDWPEGIYNFGDVGQLLRHKPYFREDIQQHNLGSPASMALLSQLKPTFAFAGHLHCKFTAIMPHFHDNSLISTTRFLALDKPLPGRPFLQVLDIPISHEISTPFALDPSKLRISYDLEWLAILKATHIYTPTIPNPFPCPPLLTISPENIQQAKKMFMEYSEKAGHDIAFPVAGNGDTCFLPFKFVATVPPYDPVNVSSRRATKAKKLGNPQTDHLLKALDLEHKITIPYAIYRSSPSLANSLNEENTQLMSQSEVNDPAEIDIDDL